MNRSRGRLGDRGIVATHRGDGRPKERSQHDEQALTMRLKHDQAPRGQFGWLPAINEPCNGKVRTSGQGRGVSP